MTFFDITALTAVTIVAVLFLLLLFEPNLPYRAAAPTMPIASREYVNYLSAIVNARLFSVSDLTVLSIGTEVYAAELDAIRSARRSIHLEVYLFLRGRSGDDMLAALTERARAGVAVRLVVDRIGSLSTPNSYFTALRAAGGRVYWYQPIVWYTLKRFNNRTHRDLLIVDGDTGFVGGVGIADFWVGPPGAGRPWRDTMVRVTGDLVKGLQTSFAENWLESSGEILPEEEFAQTTSEEPHVLPPGSGLGLVVDSTPSAGRSTRARILFQVLLASARQSIEITSPYFVPDRSLAAELLRAAARGVRVTVLTPSSWNNHPIARLASRRRYGKLLQGGVEIYEYQPAMIHAKVLIVDDTWCVLGSTNFDNRSFGINDEVNVAIMHTELGQRLQQDFLEDLARSERITLEKWEQRSVKERVLAMLGSVLERQE
jgi:cardiolipin synthase A/B